ncbi:hypothetical protein [Streptomyces cyaneofuscatus]|uniref:hypothetical protein n=1 Tax=Streptomyces cyaneofuscatus TaxID=66883 RepID=UPI0033B65E39
MGAIRSVAQSLDPAGEAVEEQNQTIETLATLAESKAEFFELSIRTSLQDAGGPGDLTVPIESVLDSVTETHAYSSKSADAIGTAVTKSLKAFCSGSQDEILGGVGSLISDGLATFLGDSSASDTTMKRYYILTEGYSIIRIDLCAWQYNVEAKGIQSIVEKVGAFVAVKSAVDMSKVKLNTFLNVYARQLATMPVDNGTVEAAIADAKRIHHEFLTTETTT